MASAQRQGKGARKGPPEQTGPRRTVWNGSRQSATFSSSGTPSRATATVSPAPQTFPPLGPQNGGPRQDLPRDRVLLQALSGLTGTTITLLTKSGQRYEGVIASAVVDGDAAGVTLSQAKEISSPGAPLKESLFIPISNIDSYTSGPADAKFTNGDSFRTDTDISKQKNLGRERDLQAWAPSGDAQGAGGALGDEETFGSSAGQPWDQFTANEQLFGVKASFDENVYTTKIDRNAPDFKEREKKAQRIAAEILASTVNNPHIAEERGIVDDTEVGEEEKYGAVVRGQNAYVPPGARKSAPTQQPAAATTSEAVKPDVPKVSVNGPDASGVAKPANKPPADPLPAFRDFVTNEKQRLTQKRQALVKNEMDKRLSELVKFSQSFKLNKPIPDDLVPILAKDSEKQKAIKDKSERDASSTSARAIGATNPTSASRGIPAKVPDAVRKPATQALSTKAVVGATPPPAVAPPPKTGSASSVTTTTKPADASVLKKIPMVIPAIPPFKGSKKAGTPATSTNGTPSGTGTPNPNGSRSPAPPTGGSTVPVSPTAANAARLNVNASSFRPNTKVAPSPSKQPAVPAAASMSPKPKQEAPAAPNPFFGIRQIKKSTVLVKDDFNPFKHNKVVDAAQVGAIWPYNGKRYMQMFPQQPHPPPQHPPHLGPMAPPPIPPPSYEEDSAAQAAARGYVYAYPQYGYPQHMMPGMPPPGPPGTYMPPYMQMPYHPGPNMPPNMYPPNMGQMQPHGYMTQPPPGAYPPPPNGAGPRPSMPPTPIPAHAHPYYHHPSPQLSHAYPMMMPPPQAMQQPHPYEGAPAQQVPMGGHA